MSVFIKKNNNENAETLRFFLLLEYSLNASETQQIEYLTNGALVTLGHYCLQRMEWTRFGKLLLTLRCLSLQPFDTALKQLFNPIIDDVIESK